MSPGADSPPPPPGPPPSGPPDEGPRHPGRPDPGAPSGPGPDRPPTQRSVGLPSPPPVTVPQPPPVVRAGGPRPGSGPPTLHFWQRISFRFGLVLTGLLLVAFFVAPGLEGLGSRLADTEPLDPRSGEDPDRDPGPFFVDGDVAAPYVDLLHLMPDTSWCVHELLRWAEPDAEGRLVPAAESVALVEAELARYGQAFTWTDCTRVLLARSASLDLPLGEFLDFGVVPAPEDLVEGALAAPEHPNVYTASQFVTRGGDCVGWFDVYTVGPPERGMFSPVDLEDEPAVSPSPRDLRRRRLLARGIDIALYGAIALLAGAFLSVLVTKRLSKLATAARTAPAAGTAGLPGPFEEGGSDEIGQLAHAMNDMRARASDLLQSLNERDNERRQWVAQVSHDLRTPLTALTACLERASDELRAGEDLDRVRKQMHERLVTARMDARRVLQLADDLLDIARLDTERALVLEPVPPGELARQVATVLSSVAEDRELQLLVDVPRGLTVLDADGSRLMRALENLVRNALEHAHTQVRLRVRREGVRILFEVEDDGPGIPTEPDGTIDFERLAVRRSRTDSAGLGLVVARRVAEAHGGRLRAENRPEGGAVFRLELPLG